MRQYKELCPVCLSQNVKLLYPLSEGQLLSCQICKLIYFTPRPTPTELDLFYNSTSYRDYYQDSPMTGHSFAERRYQQLYHLIAYHAPYILSLPNKHLLDIGCGVGDLLQIANQDGWQITGSELSPKAVEKANQLLSDRVMTGDILSLNFPENSYDLITIYHVIEHLIDPITTLKEIHRLLKPGGIAFIETPNIASLGAKIRGRKWSHITPPEHITYFQSSSLSYALKQTGFSHFKIFTNSPQVIKSIDHWLQPVKSIVKLIYNFTPLLGLGATLQAIAFK